jgi:hypothetical protein
MPKKIEEVTNEYLLIYLDDFNSLIDQELPEKYHLAIRQVTQAGALGPLMKLSETSALKVEIIDESKPNSREILRENAATLGKVRVSDQGVSSIGEKLTLVEGIE